MKKTTDAEKWRDVLWRKLEDAARGRDGAEVVRALREISEAVWEAGLDHEFARYCDKRRMTAEGVAVFENTWLAAFVTRLVTRRK